MHMTDFDNVAQRCLHAVTQIIPESQGAFYYIDRKLQAQDFHLHALSATMHRDYLDNYRPLDPLQPHHCLAIGHTVVPLQRAMRDQRRSDCRHYRRFLQHYEVADVVEVIAYTNTAPRAAISLMRNSAQGPFTEAHLTCLAGLQGLLEIAVAHLPVEPELDFLTPREQQIALLLRQGATNKQLACDLQMGLATVKTHLLNLFRKLGVSNRTELVSRLFL
ncbi:helix-turn-helix transcriptional regulator [Pseudomonas sp. IzPS59]|uniref:helix-turn-helix transcriptional regulator n=1 Tax=Pseudomonas sp. IzPS59 TaxID=2774459 RepID=UPI0017884723|nr:LuxR C-terminal-related transcriptional regulator [Pseudomonas sp. IzPS59]